MNITQIIMLVGIPAILIDLLTTKIGMLNGLKEGNPIGEKGVYVFGVLAIMFLSIIFFKYEYGALVLTLFIVTFLLRYIAIINNIKHIIQIKRLKNGRKRS